MVVSIGTRLVQIRGRHAIKLTVYVALHKLVTLLSAQVVMRWTSKENLYTDSLTNQVLNVDRPENQQSSCERVRFRGRSEDEAFQDSHYALLKQKPSAVTIGGNTTIKSTNKI